MSEKYFFQGGQNTIIDQPVDTVIQNFQNTYIAGDGSNKDKINKEIQKLIELILESKDLPDDDKEGIAEALYSIAEQVKEEKTNKFSIRGTLRDINEALSKASDIVSPASAIIALLFKLFGLS
ncbi:MAG: hypothetical protein HC880_09125 [Bacteroidia bacterium]|nr:hypothetical protein [Bacteroidia bacterium]